LGLNAVNESPVLSLLEMLFALRFRTLPSATLKRFLGQDFVVPDITEHLNVAIPLFQAYPGCQQYNGGRVAAIWGSNFQGFIRPADPTLGDNPLVWIKCPKCQHPDTVRLDPTPSYEISSGLYVARLHWCRTCDSAYPSRIVPVDTALGWITHRKVVRNRFASWLENEDPTAIAQAKMELRIGRDRSQKQKTLRTEGDEKAIGQYAKVLLQAAASKRSRTAAARKNPPSDERLNELFDRGTLRSVSKEALREWHKGKYVPGRRTLFKPSRQELIDGIRYYLKNREALQQQEADAADLKKSSRGPRARRLAAKENPPSDKQIKMHLDDGTLGLISAEGLREWHKGKDIPGRALAEQRRQELYDGVKYYFGDQKELSISQRTGLWKAAKLRTRKRRKHQIIYEERVKHGRENPLSDEAVEGLFSY
jgi:hypothetical protein